MRRHQRDGLLSRHPSRFRLAIAPLDTVTVAQSPAEIEADVVRALASVEVMSPANVAAAVGAIIGAWDTPLWEHSCAVAEYAAALAGALSLRPDHRAATRVAGLLHDIGKVAVPVAILHKPGPLTPDEHVVVRQHPEVGRRMLTAVSAPPGVVEMVSDHHERWDGMGYPAGKAGEEISVGGRVLAVADALDTILRDREYSRRKPLAWALMEITHCAGSQFDPAVVEVLHCLVKTRGREYFHPLVGVTAFHEAGRRAGG